MGNIKPKQIVWLLPFAYLLHLCDEYFSGEGFAKWFSALFKVSLSVDDFIIINLFGFAATLLIAILYSFEKINNLHLPVLSVDIPSGLDADSGIALPQAIRARKTVTMGLIKQGFLNKIAKKYLGRVVIADISLPKQLLS